MGVILLVTAGAAGRSLVLSNSYRVNIMKYCGNSSQRVA